MTIADLKQLVQILSGAVDALEASFKAQSLDFPALDKPIAPDSPAERATQAPEALEAIDLIVAASGQLSTAVRAPFTTLFEISSQAFLPAMLRFALEVNVVEILREAGPQGAHANDIAAKAGVDDQKIGHALRYLATHHVFREVAPNVFANNRISSLLDTDKTVEALQANPQTKYVGTNAAAAFVTLQARDFLPVATKISDHWTAPETKYSREPNNTVMNTTLGIKDITLFQWIERPENRETAMRYAMAMSASKFTEATDGVVEAYDWSAIPEGGLVVDVGGGVGNIMTSLYPKFSSLKFEIQDRAQTTEPAHKFWAAQFPDALPSGRVTFRAHDFHEPQPVTDAAVFYLRNIAHNWPDAYFIKTLRHLRDAATPSTRLIISDRILPYACPSSSSLESSIPGAAPRVAPKPLLANFGRASSTTFGLDMGVQVVFNGLERTISELVDVTSQAGWKIERINRIPGDISLAHLICVPA